MPRLKRHADAVLRPQRHHDFRLDGVLRELRIIALADEGQKQGAFHCGEVRSDARSGSHAERKVGAADRRPFPVLPAFRQERVGV